MNYLEICQRLRQEAGISGSGPAAVTGQTGEMAEVVDWADTAYQDIQSLHTSWRFRQSDFDVALISGTSTYTPASLSITDLLKWNTDDLRVYLETADEGWVDYVPWSEFRRNYLIGTIPEGRPSVFSVKPNNSIVFWPTPNDDFYAKGEYVMTAQSMSANTDEPIFPSDYHMLVVWRALKLYGALLAAPEKITHANEEYRRLMRMMEQTQLPDMTYGNPLA